MGVNMTRVTISHLIAGALVSLCLATAPAWALNDHTYVSGKGVDTGICTTPATACRTFAFAIAQTAASGQIIALDAANYGPVSITKSISIVADGGGPAGIFINTGTAIAINAGPSDIVNLRGLTLDGSGTADTGITNQVTSLATVGVSVTITDCFIRHFKGDGIFLADTRFYISNTVSSDNQGTGLLIGGDFGNSGVVDHFTASRNNIGISMAAKSSPADVTIVDSVMALNASDGLDVGFTQVFATATARLAGSVVTKNNGTGVNIFLGSKAFSYGDNEINGNGTDVSGTLTPVATR
jgi:hypothetical protein